MDYYGSEVDISHAQYVKLAKDNKCQLMLGHDIAAKIAESPNLQPKKKGSSAAYKLWDLVIWAGLIYSVYLSFTSEWWFFIIGIISAGALFNINNKSTAENYLLDAVNDSQFYDKIKLMGGWLYKMEEDVAKQFKVENS